MRVEYRRSIQEQIDEQIELAAKRCKIITRIILTPVERARFQDEMRHFCRDPENPQPIHRYRDVAIEEGL